MPTSDLRDMLCSYSIPLFAFGGLILLSSWVGRGEDDRWLEEQTAAVVSVDPARIDPAHDGRLVHVVGRLSHTPEAHTDPWSGLTHGGFAILRRGEEYGVWPADGGSHTPYWRPVGSLTAVWLPAEVRVGAFTLDPVLVSLVVGDATGIAPQKYVGGQEFTPAERMANQLKGAVARLTVIPMPAGKAASGWEGGGEWLYSPVPTDRMGYGQRRVQYLRLDLPTDTVTLLARQSEDRLEPMPRPQAPTFADSWSGEVGVSDAFADIR
ncbi:MAG: hypothetical protein MUF18_08140, partial [Fimbriiglobus sp.]|nr:hypothetical protein [Fimbriiglobus sp.]